LSNREEQLPRKDSTNAYHLARAIYNACISYLTQTHVSCPMNHVPINFTYRSSIFRKIERKRGIGRTAAVLRRIARHRTARHSPTRRIDQGTCYLLPALLSKAPRRAGAHSRSDANQSRRLVLCRQEFGSGPLDPQQELVPQTLAFQRLPVKFAAFEWG
jgi:hypothetical protein